MLASSAPIGWSALATTLVVENMHCGGCMRKVEAALTAVPGIASARANLSARRVTAIGRDVATADLIDALARAGFKAAPLVDEAPDPALSTDRDLLKRLGVAGFAAANIMLLSVSVWSASSGDMTPAVQSLFHWLSALIALPAVAYAGQPFFRSAGAGARARRVNMDVPISLGVTAGDADEPLPDRARQRAGLLRCGDHAAVLSARRPIPRSAHAGARGRRRRKPARAARHGRHGDPRRRIDIAPGRTRADAGHARS